MIAAAACLSFTSVVAPSATALAAGYTGLAQEANGNWYYYNNGQKVTSGTNLVQNEYFPLPDLPRMNTAGGES